MPYRLVYVRNDHPLAPPRAGKDRRNVVQVWEHRLVLWNKVRGKGAPCHWCGTPLRWTKSRHEAGALTADHLNGDRTDNRPENLVPSCHACNVSRGHKLGDDVLSVPHGAWRTRAVERQCLTCGTTFLIAAAQLRSRKNAGRYCSRDCMYARNRRTP